jgi:hypothetical protein
MSCEALRSKSKMGIFTPSSMPELGSAAIEGLRRYILKQLDLRSFWPTAGEDEDTFSLHLARPWPPRGMSELGQTQKNLWRAYLVCHASITGILDELRRF